MHFPPPKESNKKYGVGILLLYPIFQASRIALTVDKTIAHTNLDNIEKPYNKYKVDIYQMVWCYCCHLHGHQILREFGK